MARNVPKAGSTLKLRGGNRGNLSLVKDNEIAAAVAGSSAADVSIEQPPKPRKIVANKELSDLWDDIVPELTKAGVVSRIDGPSLELMIRHFHASQVASDELIEDGTSTVWDEKNGRWAKHPAEVVFRSESMAFMAYAKEMGMTFASRARIPSQKNGVGDADNPFAGTGS